MEKYTLFNGCDEWIINFIDLKAFEESLLMNILFQKRILIHESYFFNSNLLAQHIKTSIGGLSLFEVAAQKGLIIPAIRDQRAEILRDAFSTLEKVNQNANYKLLTDEIAPFKNQIIESVDKGLRVSNIKPFYWPEPTDDKNTLGVEYLNILRRFFQQENPPHIAEKSIERQQILLRVWEEKSWRFDVIESAVEATKRNGNKGLQRMELFRCLGKEIGIPKSIETAHFTDINKYVHSDEKKMRAFTYIKWLAQCHHLAQSIIFDTTLNFPVYNYSNDFLLDSLFVNHLDTGKTLQNADSVTMTTLLPPIELMIKVKPAEIVAIREDMGLGYIAALDEWEQNPSDKTKHEVEIAIKAYCSSICKKYDSELLPIMISCERGKDEMSTSGIFKEGKDIAKNIPGVKYFFQLSNLIKVTYKYLNNKKTKSLVEQDI